MFDLINVREVQSIETIYSYIQAFCLRHLKKRSFCMFTDKIFQISKSVNMKVPI